MKFIVAAVLTLCCVSVHSRSMLDEPIENAIKSEISPGTEIRMSDVVTPLLALRNLKVVINRSDVKMDSKMIPLYLTSGKICVDTTISGSHDFNGAVLNDMPAINGRGKFTATLSNVCLNVSGPLRRCTTVDPSCGPYYCTKAVDSFETNVGSAVVHFDNLSGGGKSTSQWNADITKLSENEIRKFPDFFNKAVHLFLGLVNTEMDKITIGTTANAPATCPFPPPGVELISVDQYVKDILEMAADHYSTYHL